MERNVAFDQINEAKESIRVALSAYCFELVEMNETGILCMGYIRKLARRLTEIPADNRLKMVINMIKDEAVLRFAK